MSIFDRWFGLKDTYFDADALTKQYQAHHQDLSKSFHPGTADQRVDDAYIQINGGGTDDNNNQRSKLNREYFLRKKERLRGYSTDLLVQAIIRTRTNQVLQFAVPVSRSSDGNGYRIVRKGKKYGEMTTHEKNVAHKLAMQIYNTGKIGKDWRDDFPTFVARILYDFFVYDQVNIERVFENSHSNKLNHFNHVDAGTILIDKYPKSVDKPRTYLQMINRKKQATFDSKHLVFATYWNQSNVVSGGYGFSPVEAAIPQITYHINVEQFNARFFSQGGMTRGLLLIDPGDGGPTSHASLDALRRNLMPGQGINGSWKIPVIQAHDAKYVNMTQSSKDMEFVNFLNYLNNIICADFQIDPLEVNFPNRGGANGKGQGTTLNEGNTTRTKMGASQHKGLAPIMKFIERLMTDQILKYIDDRYEFVFTPSQEGQEKAKQEEYALMLKNGMSVNECRDLMGLPKLDNIPNVPGNSDNLIQYLSVQSKLTDPEANKVQQHSKDYKPGHTDSDAQPYQDQQVDQGDQAPDKQVDSQQPDNSQEQSSG